jgi:hypothetical protein
MTSKRAASRLSGRGLAAVPVSTAPQGDPPPDGTALSLQIWKKEVKHVVLGIQQEPWKGALP